MSEDPRTLERAKQIVDFLIRRVRSDTANDKVGAGVGRWVQGLFVSLLNPLLGNAAENVLDGQKVMTCKGGYATARSH